jgi:hypothetical protein
LIERFKLSDIQARAIVENVTGSRSEQDKLTEYEEIMKVKSVKSFVSRC